MHSTSRNVASDVLRMCVYGRKLFALQVEGMIYGGRYDLEAYLAPQLLSQIQVASSGSPLEYGHLPLHQGQPRHFDSQLPVQTHSFVAPVHSSQAVPSFSQKVCPVSFAFLNMAIKAAL